MNETKAIAHFRKLNPSGFWRKLHGNIFQQYLPDVLWINEGAVTFLEFKVIPAKTLSWSKLRLGQHLTMIQMQKAGAKIFYQVWSESAEKFYQISPDQIRENETFSITD